MVRRAAWNGSASIPRARRFWSITRTRRTRSKTPSSRFAPIAPAASSWCSARAATATPASGRRWAPSPSCSPTSPSSPTTIRAAKIPPRSAAPFSPPARAPSRSATALWTAAEADSATGGASTRAWQADGVSIDSRSLARGDLFVALAGPRVDGHDFLGDAFASGASAAVVHRRPPGSDNELPLLIVRDTMAALGDLGAAARKRSGARIVAVTGSVGKTGTKEALRQALGRLGPTHASAGSLNNQWGVPLSLSRMPRDARFGVFELGMNHPGEIEALSKLARPHVALITTVEAAHLGFFSSVAAIADA